MEDNKVSKKQKLDNDLAKVANQLEYYFSDVNIVNDKFLLDEFKKDDGWIKLTTLLTFQRLKSLTEDPEKLANSLENHGTEGFLELSSCKSKVKRKKPLPDIDQFKKELQARTLHISGFPLDSTFDDLHRFCVKYGEVESVSMRRHFKTRAFKGCIMAVFKKQEDAKKVLDSELLKLKDRELLKEDLDAFNKRKAEKKEKYLLKKNKGKKETEDKETEDKRATD